MAFFYYRRGAAPTMSQALNRRDEAVQRWVASVKKNSAMKGTKVIGELDVRIDGFHPDALYLNCRRPKISVKSKGGCKFVPKWHRKLWGKVKSVKAHKRGVAAMAAVAVLGALAYLMYGALEAAMALPALGAVKTWDQSDGNLASTDANWSGAAAPEAADEIVFDSTSVANCTFDLALTFDDFTLDTGYSGTVTQAEDFGCVDFALVAGTFTADNSYTITCQGDLSFDVSRWTQWVGNIIMSGADKSITCSTINMNRLYTLTINDDTTIMPDATLLAADNLTIAAAKSLTLDDCNLFCYGAAITKMTNNNIIDGSGEMRFLSVGNRTFGTLGTINCAVVMRIDNGYASTTYTLSSNTSFGNTLEIASADATSTITLSHGTNYTLEVTGAMTLSTRGKMTQGTGTWTFSSTYTQSGAGSVFTQGGDIVQTGDFLLSDGIFIADSHDIDCAGDWDSSAGDFQFGTSTLIMSGSGKTLKLADPALPDYYPYYNLYDLTVSGTVTLQSSVFAFDNVTGGGNITEAGFTVYSRRAHGYDGILDDAVVLADGLHNYQYLLERLSPYVRTDFQKSIMFAPSGAGAEFVINAPFSAKTSETIEATGNYLKIRVKTDAGAPGDAEYGAVDGIVVLNTNEGRIYFRSGGSWHFAALT